MRMKELTLRIRRTNDDDTFLEEGVTRLKKGDI